MVIHNTLSCLLSGSCLLGAKFPHFPSFLGCTSLLKHQRLRRVRAERGWVGAALAAKAALQGCCHRPLWERTVIGGDARSPKSVSPVDVSSESTNMTHQHPSKFRCPWVLCVELTAPPCIGIWGPPVKANLLLLLPRQHFGGFLVHQHLTLQRKCRSLPADGQPEGKKNKKAANQPTSQPTNQAPTDQGT